MYVCRCLFSFKWVGWVINIDHLNHWGDTHVPYPRWPHPNCGDLIQNGARSARFNDVQADFWPTSSQCVKVWHILNGYACGWLDIAQKISKICHHIIAIDMLNLRLWCSKCILPHRRDEVPALMRWSNRKYDVVTAELRILYCLIHEGHAEEHSICGNKKMPLPHNTWTWETTTVYITSSIFDAGH